MSLNLVEGVNNLCIINISQQVFELNS